MKLSVYVAPLQAWLAPLRAICDEGIVQFDHDRILAQCVDPAHVAMVDVRLGADAFTWIEKPVQLPLELGMDFDVFGPAITGAMRRGTKSVTLELDEKNRIVLKYGGLTRRFKTVDVDGLSKPKLPTLNLPIETTILAHEVLEALKDCRAVSDHAMIRSSSVGFQIFADDADGNEVLAHWAFDQLEQVRLLTPRAEKNVVYRSLFALDYLENMLRSCSATHVRFQVGTDYPTIMEWEIKIPGAQDVGHAILALAPRIESDEADRVEAIVSPKQEATA